MKKRNFLLIIIAYFVLSACGNSIDSKRKDNQVLEDSTTLKTENMLEKINKISITPLPIGVEHLDSIKQLDYNDFGMYNVPISYSVDTQDKYGLNDILSNRINFLGYDSNLENLRASIISLDSVQVYLSKRLPPKGNYNFLLCKVIQHTGLGTFTGWILFVIKDQAIRQFIQVAQSQTVQETFSYTLFKIDKDFKIYTNIYKTSYDTPPYNIAHLSGKQTYVFSTEEGIFKLEKEGYIQDDGRFVELGDDEGIIN